MERRCQFAFLFLILAQGAHSIEEYATRFYEVFAPARFVSSLISNDLSIGFLVVNTALVTFGLWCWAVPVRSGWHAARGFAWFWTILELATDQHHQADLGINVVLELDHISRIESAGHRPAQPQHSKSPE